MKVKFFVSFFGLILAISLLTVVGFAQEVKPSPEPKKDTKQDRPRVTNDDKATDTQKTSDVPKDILENRTPQLLEEEAAIVPYYNNFLTTYHLGPEDVISVEVFNLDRYSRKNITVPPNGKITLPLIGSVSVQGKTTDQVGELVTKLLQEYVIDPKVTVSLEKAMSARYSVLGDVPQPGIKVMTRRLSIYEAVAEAGGVLQTGDKKNVTVLRRQADGNFIKIPVNIKDIEQGKAKGMIFLVPGDQIVVPGKKIGLVDRVMKYAQVFSFAMMFKGF